MKKTIIGITLDNEEKGGYSKFPWYAIRKNYLHSIEKFGGIPFPLFHSLSSINKILNIIDGLISKSPPVIITPSIKSRMLSILFNEWKSGKGTPPTFSIE